MTTSTFALSHPSPVQMYFQNLGLAARHLGAALIAAVPPQGAADAALATAKLVYGTPASKAEAADELGALASQFEATQPNQAAELRWLASRG
jgi:hypothetical protein